MSTKWTLPHIRQTYITHFLNHGHVYVPSSPTIPVNDTTLLFANSGMNQFKQIFCGREQAKAKKVANSQKCIRAGGKHNDLDDVGKDTYHHTFFEMLGNWSFGDYFKKEAIEMAWDLLINVYKLPKDRLYVTYHAGDKALGVQEDTEARDLWLKIGIDPGKLVPYGSKENFWEMGDQGPCGPCSEIHYDRVGGRNATHLVNQDDPEVIEIWNIVFMQFNREPDGSLRPLPSKNIDTGMGLERLASILQDKMSNYDTDAFMPLFERIQELTNAVPYGGKLGAEDVDGIDMAYRVIADHIRTLTFAIADGCTPSNEGQGYVLRRILRRGCRYARRRFNVELGNFFPRIVDTLVANMGEAYPEIVKAAPEVKELLREEEITFAKTLDRGEKIFEGILAQSEKTISGEDAWRMYDTYGFPVDLTLIMAEENGKSIDMDGYNKAQERSREISRGVTKSSEKGIKMTVHTIDEATKAGLPKTIDSFKYEKGDIKAKVVGVYTAEDTFATSAKTGEHVGVILDQTNFYAEAGGQEYDTGVLIIDGQIEFVVEGVERFGDFVLHTGRVKYGTLKVGDELICTYNEERRHPLRANHTATHLLNFALRKVLKTDIEQKGSLVAQDRLRFDFGLKNAPTPDQIAMIETEVEKFVRSDIEVQTKIIPLEEAKKITGLRAVFGEVYPDPVRVVAVGESGENIFADPQNEKWLDASIEFCGGTHAFRTSDIRRFAIQEESSIAKGIRRIVALTGEAAACAYRESEQFKPRIDALESLSNAELENALKPLRTELDKSNFPYTKKLEYRKALDTHVKRSLEESKARQAAAQKAATAAVQDYLTNGKDSKFIVGILDADNKSLATAMKQASSSSVPVVMLSNDSSSNKVHYQAFVPASLSSTFKATEWIQVVGDYLGGRVGGKDGQAMGAADASSKSVDEGVKLLEQFAKMKLEK